ncbi:MAG: HlyD family efflux transporter periplasmic adaptor subunit [Proteiniphilum sp.]|jgi:HlyD family secretion protein|nr:HlyD family efflux transporter periplasmic adaptor subunit [Proteiniphilum sp.]
MNHRIINRLSALVIGLLAVSCGGNHLFDASGAFEAEETIISSQAQGVILRFDLEEGQTLAQGETVGYVDSLPLCLKKEQLLAQMEALSSRKPDVKVQLASLQEQLNAAQRERERTSALVRGNAATTKQLDDMDDRTVLLKRQIEAQKSSLDISTRSIDKEIRALQIQVEQLDDQLNRCKIVNPVNGTVLTKYARVNETTAAGKPLYRIADLSEMTLRVYISGNQLPQIRLNQQVKVHTDDGNGGFATTEGRVAWISDKAEFTPKTVQTKDERANLVYAVKIRVKNDGSYKIGMYGEISFD